MTPAGSASPIAGAPPSGQTAHVDTFARDNLPPHEDWPHFRFTFPDGTALSYPAQTNCAVELLDRMVEGQGGDRLAIHSNGRTLTYRQVLDRANQIANVLRNALGVVPGNRVLLRGPNNAATAICWFAVLKAGAIAVTTMPLLRTREIGTILTRARISLALCDDRFLEEMEEAAAQVRQSSGLDPRIIAFSANGEGVAGSLDAMAAEQPATFANVETASDDIALIAFTSGTTGQPKGTVHFHRDVLAICDCFSRHILQPEPDDVFLGTPPLAFTFALGGLLLFPFRVGASTILIEQPSPTALLDAVRDYRATILFTAPTMYRRLTGMVADYDISSLIKGVSAGETLPAAVSDGWHAATGIRLIDGIGATEMLHIFISASGEAVRPGATGKPVPGYEACIVDDEMHPLPPGEIGRLAVRGPTGCRYLADPERQRVYVRAGWNLTGDMYLMDPDGYFHYQARADDMIISSGYNIAGPEVENVLLEHPQVQECAVVGLPDPERGMIVAAFSVLTDPTDASDALAVALQDFVKREIAPYKYPRRITFVPALPHTETGKLQRYKLRQEG
jgi:2-aminobenzoate-CoA ligase